MTSVLAPDPLGPTVCVGEILVEIVATTVGDGFLKAQPLVGPFASGAPAIFISQCGRLGGKAAMVGAVGDDDFGRVNTDRLKRDGVDVSTISIDPDYPTGSAFVRYRKDGSRDFVYNIATSAAARFGWSQAVGDLIHRSGHLHVMGSALSVPSARAVIDKAVDIVKARGGTLSVDPNIRKELKLDEDTERRFSKLVAATDLLLPSGEELERAAGVEGEAEAIRRLFEIGVKEIVLKRGAEGATYFGRDGDRIDAPAFVVQEVDPTGAGDCFGGAYLTCRRLGMSPQQALTYASAAGARNVTVLGPMEGAGTQQELDAFIASTERRP
ncbi:tagatose kinase [Rhizobium leguminosarum]|uniref:tagatose kinase n=1 Tax=Rhizobium leguminosarum TaxID=384 RepID=UPI00143FAD5B|nr:sugar kinase [Rhizobium leguminosarum]NKK64126.1 sugar kinase [Rhizobium leguminosarum bv. viciae]NKL07270.1 sugar kinase [Rhizobium leguminosarum bv. viciae]NKL82452.1 sugar kinase [Rhizobium leguminosarum bv. viciae]NKL93199.1 sugar kinase [Rhizobium leguminosarum bv. viciae]NKM90943.1 sugar kinase [Rhizobium leguminosarum bv. viciae]